MSFKLDISKMKHIKSDDKSTTLQHPAGHLITLAHNVLSKPHQEALKALSKISSENATEGQKQEAQDKNQYGKVIMKADGGKVPVPDSPTDSATSDRQRNLKEASTVERSPTDQSQAATASSPSQMWSNVKNAWAEGGKVKPMYAEGTKDGPVPASLNMDQANHYREAARLAEKAGDSMGMPTNTNNETPQTQIPNQGPNQAPSPILQPGMPGYNEPIPLVDDTASGNTVSSPDQQIDQGNDHYGHMQAEQPKPQDTGSDLAPVSSPTVPPTPGTINIPRENVSPNPELPAQNIAQDTKHEYMTEDQAFQQDLNNGHITPKTYRDLFAERSTLGKISGVFGLLLSGMGSGLAGQPNMALQMMNNVIKNDLDAQVKSKDNAQNLIKINQQRLMNESEMGLKAQQGLLTSAQAAQVYQEAAQKAYNLANMQANRTALHSLTQMVTNLPPGAQRQAAEAQLAMLAQSVNTENYQIADRAASQAALMGFANGNGDKSNPEQAFQSTDKMLRMGGQKELAEDMESKHIPGVGQASIPVPEAARNRITAYKTTLDQLNQAINFKQDHPGAAFSPSDRAKAETLMSNLGNQVRVAEDMGVFKPSEAELMKHMLGKSPADFLSAVRTEPKLKEMLQLKQGEQQKLYQQYGLKSQSTRPQQDQESTSKSGRPIILVNGKWQYK